MVRKVGGNVENLNLTEQEVVRREKMETLPKEQGIAPFGQRYDRTHRSGQLREQYGEMSKEELVELE